MIEIYLQMIISVLIQLLNLNNLDWSAISAAFAVVISLVVLGLQRKDIEKQSIYQRATFELQNEINQNNILFELVSQIVGNIQEQKHILQQLYYDLIAMKSNKFELSKKNYKKYERTYNKEYSDIDELLNNITQFNNQIDEHYHYIRELNKDFTSKGSALQLHMIGRYDYKEIKYILVEIEKLLKNMRNDCYNIKLIEEEKLLPCEEDIDKWCNKNDEKIEYQISDLKECFVKIKELNLKKQEKLEILG